jgi:hypothetical protein
MRRSPPDIHWIDQVCERPHRNKGDGMQPTTSDAPRTLQGATTEHLTHLSLRELLQRLAACEESLRSTQPVQAVHDGLRDREEVLQDEARITRELRRRRHLRRLRPHPEERRHSAAWPRPPW